MSNSPFRAPAVVFTAFMAAAVLLLAGCGTKDEEQQASAARQSSDANNAESLASFAPVIPLTPTDFLMYGIGEETDAESVRHVLGKPDSTFDTIIPGDTATTIMNWKYRDMLVTFDAAGTVFGITITSAALATSRGLRVGDPAVRVAQLYGKPSEMEPSLWQYTNPEEPLHAVQVEIHANKVTAIYAGWLVE